MRERVTPLSTSSGSATVRRSIRASRASIIRPKQRLYVFPSSITQSNGVNNVHTQDRPHPCLIDRLPAEILLMTLSMLPREHVKGLSLVCRRWKNLIYATSSWWRSIQISPWKQRSPTEEIPRLDFLIQRAGTGSTPLHVIWQFASELNALTSGNEKQLSQIFMERIPSSRIQSLEVDQWFTDYSSTLEYFRGQTVLKKLTISSLWRTVLLLRALDEANIRVPNLHIQDYHFLDDNVGKQFQKLFGEVSTLKVRDSIPRCFRTGSNITNFSIDVLPYTPWAMPKLKVLHVTSLFDLDHFALANVPLLETLHIECIEDGGELSSLKFPSLRSLTISSGELWPLSYFEAGRLDTLCVDMPNTNLKKATGIVTRLLSESTYTLSPINLYLNLPLEVGYIAWFLRRATRIKRLIVTIDEKVQPSTKEFVKEILSQLQYEENEKLVQTWRLCPDLESLYLRLSWAQNDASHWKVMADKILRGRSTGALVKVTCEWSDGRIISLMRKEIEEPEKISI